MSDALSVFVPLFAFMLLPVWIPILAVTIGWVGDQLGSNQHDEVVARFAAAKERSRAHRGLHAHRGAAALPEAA
jgi:hypothetical protein